MRFLYALEPAVAVYLVKGHCYELPHFLLGAAPDRPEVFAALRFAVEHPQVGGKRVRKRADRPVSVTYDQSPANELINVGRTDVKGRTVNDLKELAQAVILAQQLRHVIEH